MTRPVTVPMAGEGFSFFLWFESVLGPPGEGVTELDFGSR